MITYIPVMAGEYFNKYHLFDRMWWSTNPIFPYNYIMVSYGSIYGTMVSADKVRDYFRIRDDVKVFYDSGGYEILVHNLNIDAIDVAHSQINSLKKDDVAFILDVPVGRFWEVNIPIEHVEKCADKTRDNIERSYKIYSEANCKVYGVLQGSSEEHLELWWKKTIEPYFNIFSGIAFPYRRLDNVAMITLRFIKSKGWNKPVHIFSFSSFEVLPVYTQISKDFPEITVDSSSITYATWKASVRVPITLSVAYSGRKSIVEEHVDLSKYCVCPVCLDYKKKYSTFQSVKMNDVSADWMIQHNTWWFIQSFLTVNYLLESGKLDRLVDKKLLSMYESGGVLSWL